MTRQEWERVARKQLGVDPDAMIPPTPTPAPPAAGSIVVFLADGREIDITGKVTAEELAAVRQEIGTAAILRTEHRIPSSPELRELLERRRREARS